MNVESVLHVFEFHFGSTHLHPSLRVPTTVTDVSRNLAIFGHICDLVCVCMYVWTMSVFSLSRSAIFDV